jgi:hypothetical protein
LRAQAALEYLMTYGWAILIIVIAIGALYAMGVFNVGASATCSPCFPAGSDFTYQDHSVVGNTLYLSVQEGPNEIVVTNVTAANGATSYNDTQVTIPSNAHQVLLVDVTGLTSASSYALDIVVTYTRNNIPHTQTATLHVSP